MPERVTPPTLTLPRKGGGDRRCVSSYPSPSTGEGREGVPESREGVTFEQKVAKCQDVERLGRATRVSHPNARMPERVFNLPLPRGEVGCDSSRVRGTAGHVKAVADGAPAQLLPLTRAARAAHPLPPGEGPYV